MNSNHDSDQAPTGTEPDSPSAQNQDNGIGAPFPWWMNWKFMLPTWGIIAAFIWLGIHFHIDKHIIASSVFLIGLLSNAFAWLLGVIAVVPLVGPLIVKILSLGFIWLLNAVGYLVSFVAIRRGYSKDVLTYRGVTIALIVGIVIGYIIGKLV
ncbi:MAG: hypothetical protein LBD10_00530 [Desulfobulbus sp.]|jgi:hypothetical protein|uniref:hypothetical protein n=1 Tax=Desulfobulbus sp. TaxID=895 RepID=UPI0028418BA4|nr:hypothetical protein [Desulfobulbus sp.]MDR2548688.1 hypothetical protein [Desulfobulbus sp.]